MLKSLCLFIAGCMTVCAQTITVTSSPNPATFGQQVTLTATVQGAGTAVFAENGQTIGTAPVVGGQAVLTTKPAAPGTRTIRVFLNGASGSTSFYANASSPYSYMLQKNEGIDMAYWQDLNGDGVPDRLTAGSRQA